MRMSMGGHLACTVLALLAFANLTNAKGGQIHQHKEVAKVEESGKGLRILMMIPVFDFNRSHVNFAVAKFRVLREKYNDNVDFVLPYFIEEDIKYLENSVEKELYEKMKFYKLMNPGKKVKEAKMKEAEVKKEAEEVNKHADKGKEKEGQSAAMAQQKPKTFEEMTTLGEILQFQKFVPRIKYFPKIWIDMIENDYFKGKHFDVGIAEYSLPSQYAFAVFDALKIKHWVVSRAYSPSAMNYDDLGLLPSLIDARIPPVERTNIGDHLIDPISYENSERKKEITEDYNNGANGANTALIKIDKEEFTHLQDKLPIFRECMANGKSTLREMFKRATFFLVNSQPEMEFDGGELLTKHGNGPKVKMIGGIHLKKETNEATEMPRNANFIDKNPVNQKGIEQVRQKMKAFAGYVLISFGSVVDTKKDGALFFVQMEAILGTIRRMPNYLFIWQLTKGDPMIEKVNRDPDVPNVFATDWVDQQGILAHPETMAFVSHCGKNSLYESLFHGIPPICVPNFGDQFYNAETGAKHGYGSVLDFYCIELNDHEPSSLLQTKQQFTIPNFKSSGKTKLVPLAEKFHNKSSAVKQWEFLQQNEKQTDKKEDRIVPVPGNNNKFCFHERNIQAAIEEAIKAKKGQNGKGPIKSKNLHQVQRKLREHNPHQVLLEAMDEIAGMEGKHPKHPMVEMETGTKHKPDDHNVGEGSHAKNV